MIKDKPPQPEWWEVWDDKFSLLIKYLNKKLTILKRILLPYFRDIDRFLL